MFARAPPPALRCLFPRIEHMQVRWIWASRIPCRCWCECICLSVSHATHQWPAQCVSLSYSQCTNHLVAFTRKKGALMSGLFLTPAKGLIYSTKDYYLSQEGYVVFAHVCLFASLSAGLDKIYWTGYHLIWMEPRIDSTNFWSISCMLQSLSLIFQMKVFFTFWVVFFFFFFFPRE